jgi:hypothetical protein
MAIFGFHGIGYAHWLRMLSVIDGRIMPHSAHRRRQRVILQKHKPHHFPELHV